MKQMLQYYIARDRENSENVHAETHAQNADMESSSSVASAASSGIASSQNLIRSLGSRTSQGARDDMRDVPDGCARNAPSGGQSERSADQGRQNPQPRMGIAMPATEQGDENTKVRKRMPSR